VDTRSWVRCVNLNRNLNPPSELPNSLHHVFPLLFHSIRVANVLTRTILAQPHKGIRSYSTVTWTKLTFSFFSYLLLLVYSILLLQLILLPEYQKNFQNQEILSVQFQISRRTFFVAYFIFFLLFLSLICNRTFRQILKSTSNI